MENDLSLRQAVVCFAINTALFLLAGLLCTLERGGY